VQLIAAKNFRLLFISSAGLSSAICLALMVLNDAEDGTDIVQRGLRKYASAVLPT
jgi:hypothetical protein